MTQSDGKQNEVPESDKMLAQIEEAQQALRSKAESTSVKESPSAQNVPEKAPEPTAKQEAAPQGQAASQSEAPTDKKADKPEVDAIEWARKKGLRSEEAMARSLRELEQKLSRTTAELKVKEANIPPGYQPPPYYQAQPQWQPQPMYAPVPPSYPDPSYQDRIIEQEAARRGLDKEDFKKVLDIANEVAEAKLRRANAENQAWRDGIERQTRRTTELSHLMQDPLFTNEKMQFEMHRVLEENPQAFALEPMPYTYAFNEAQRRLGRQSLQERAVDSDRRPNLPTTPPTDSGKSSSPSFEESKENRIMKEFQAAKSADEQKQILTRLGAVQTI